MIVENQWLDDPDTGWQFSTTWEAVPEQISIMMQLLYISTLAPEISWLPASGRNERALENEEDVSIGEQVSWLLTGSVQ
jgi:hypothetical protein